MDEVANLIQTEQISAGTHSRDQGKQLIIKILSFIQ
jgi:hypothetical protein